MKNIKEGIILFLEQYEMILNDEYNKYNNILDNNIFDTYHKTITNLLSISIDPIKLDWLEWWIYEARFGHDESIAMSAIIKDKKFDFRERNVFVNFLFSDDCF